VNTPKRFVLLFDSIHDVLRAEKWFKARNVWFDLVPTPKDLSSDCGMSLQIREDSLPLAHSEQAAIGWKKLVPV
jgi:hypothetical protein